MKKTLALIVLFSAILLTIVSAQNYVEREYDFVYWSMPDDWQPFNEDFMPGVEFYNGETKPGNEITEGAVFAVVTQKGFANGIISEMKKDPSTNLQIEAKNYLNGMERDYYEGLIDNNGKSVWFTLSFFPADGNHEEFMVFGIATGPNMNRDKSLLNHIIASVDVKSVETSPPDTPLKRSLITITNSEDAIFEPGSLIEFQYEVAEDLLKGSPWIGIIPSDIPHGDEAENDRHDLTYIYIVSNIGQKNLKAPEEAGKYDIRLHDTDFNGKELGYTSFEVKNELNSQPIITTDKQVYTPGEEIKITFKNAPAETSSDWIGLYPSSSDESDYLSWQYLQGEKEGEITFTSPRDPGEYNIRLFNDDSYNTIAVSNVFKVSEKDKTEEEPEKETVFISHYECCSTIRDGKAVDSKLKFSQKDEKIYILLTLEEYRMEHQLIWEWVKPEGEIFDTISLDLESASELGYESIRNYNVWSWLNTSSLTESLKGIWKVNIYLDDEIVLTRQFIFN